MNSKYTKQIFAENFKILNFLGVKPDILYPAIDFKKFKKIANNDNNKYGSRFFLSLNRYERKKNINLAI